MNIGLIDVDGHNFPNLALMKISAWHKSKGDTVEWCLPMDHYDIVYQSKVFDETYSPDIDWIPNANKIVKGGTGYFRRKEAKGSIYGISEVYYDDKWLVLGNSSTAVFGNELYREFLPYDVEHSFPDYSLYPKLTRDISTGTWPCITFLPPTLFLSTLKSLTHIMLEVSSKGLLRLKFNPA